MFALSNPLWSDSAIYDFRDRLAAVVPPAWLPIEVPGSKRPTFKELGCGSYGCVMPTGTPGIVCKVTTDVLEARFVQAAINLRYWPEGIVQYKKIVALGDRTYRKRPMFVLWREEAFEVGELNEHVSSLWGSQPASYDYLSAVQFQSRLFWFGQVSYGIKKYAATHPNMLQQTARYESWAHNITAEHYDELFERMQRHTYEQPINKLLKLYRGIQRNALALEICETLAELMENEPEGYLVGGTLGHYLDKGILLADVHSMNIGKANRADYNGLTPWVVTDPGHAIFLDNRHEPLTIQVA